jgi:hypothetical protein
MAFYKQGELTAEVFRRRLHTGAGRLSLLIHLKRIG